MSKRRYCKICKAWKKRSFALLERGGPLVMIWLCLRPFFLGHYEDQHGNAVTPMKREATE